MDINIGYYLFSLLVTNASLHTMNKYYNDIKENTKN